MTEREALKALVNKLTAIETNKDFQGIWGFLWSHGYAYKGPDWKRELDDARLALTSH